MTDGKALKTMGFGTDRSRQDIDKNAEYKYGGEVQFNGSALVKFDGILHTVKDEPNHKC